MTTQIGKSDAESIILKSTGVSSCAEDRSYELKPIEWYFKKPWYGLRKYFYVKEACDCDDFCTIFKYELLRRYLKTVESSASRAGGSYPALPVFQAKVQLTSGVNHFCLFVIADDGTYFIERTGDSIRYIERSEIKEIWKIQA
jgi:hypothetical protein